MVQYGDFNWGSSIPYYTHRRVWLYNGRWGTNLDYGSRYPDAPQIFLDDATFPAFWQQPNRVFLYVSGEGRDDAFKRLPADASYVLAESGGKFDFRKSTGPHWNENTGRFSCEQTLIPVLRGHMRRTR